MPLSPGTHLGRYEVIRLLGAGGMGEVYLAKDERLEREVALKVLPTGTLADESARKRFRREALALSKLNHPNIETVHDFDTHEGVDFLVMEYVAGYTLTDRLASGALSEKEVAALGGQIASALEEAHEQGVVHRDLKPGNILVTPKGQMKLLDFGLARLLEPVAEGSQVQTISQSGSTAGTMPYMAPEQLRAENVDARTDIFALGAVLYEMATGQRTFKGDSSPQVTDAILHQAPVTPRALNAQVSPDMERIVLKCLEKDPALRYQSATEIGVDLRRLGTLSGAVQPAAAVSPGMKSRAAGVLIAIAFAAVLVLLVGLNVGGVRERLFGGGGPGRIESLAVLPLENLSGDPEQEYFAAGMTEALITNLSKIGALKVISRTSAMRYKGSDKSLPQIARELGVDGLIEGSVLRVGDRVRITAQLIEAATDEHLWAESYERDLQNILALQSELARVITNEIKVKVTPQEQAQLARAQPVDPEAYQLYLKGNFQLTRVSEAGFSKAVEHYQQAIEKDPTYAPAYAGLSVAYLELGGWHSSVLPTEELRSKAKSAAQKALELDDKLAEAHIAMGRIKHLHEWDWQGAERAFRRGIELNPNVTVPRNLYASYLTAMGRSQESIAFGKRTLEIDPLSPAAYNEYGWALWDSGRDEEALEQFRKGLELDPDFQQSHSVLAVFYLIKGLIEKAVKHNEKAENSLGETRPPTRLGRRGYVYARAGRRVDALRILNELKRRAEREHVPAGPLADLYLGLGEYEKALALLERSYEERGIDLVWLKVHPKYDPLRDDPRFQDLLRRMNFPE